MNSSDFKATGLERLSGRWGKAILLFLAFIILTFIVQLVTKLIPAVGSLVAAVIQVPLIYGFTYSFLDFFDKKDTTAFGFLSKGFENFGRAWGVTFHTFMKLIVPFLLILIPLLVIPIVSIFYSVSSQFSITDTSEIELAYNGNTGIDPDMFRSELPLVDRSQFMVKGIISVVCTITSIVFSIVYVVKSYYYSLGIYLAIDNPTMSAKQAVEKSKELMTGNRGKLFTLQLSFLGWAILASLTFGIGYLWLFPYMQCSTIAFYKKVSGKDIFDTTIVNPISQA